MRKIHILLNEHLDSVTKPSYLGKMSHIIVFLITKDQNIFYNLLVLILICWKIVI